MLDGASTIARRTYSYDANANLSYIDDKVWGLAYDHDPSYDDLDRLSRDDGYYTNGVYSYDALGNIKSKTENAQSMSYHYDTTLNRLTSITGSNARTYSYDAHGNVTGDGNQTYSYNFAGNMTQSTAPSIDYYYDGHQRRVRKAAGGDSYSVYSLSGQLMHKSVGGVTTDYLYAGSLLVAEQQGSTSHYLHTDLLGSPIAGDNGSTWNEYYYPWGEGKFNPIAMADDVGYTGHQKDTATSLTYMQARYYDPVIGRFMAVDPVQFDGGNPRHFGRYTYTLNNPVNRVDPDGRSPCNGSCSELFGTRQPASFDGDIIDAALIAVEFGLVAGDLALGGPTGEGIGPALAVRAARLGRSKGTQRAATKHAKKSAVPNGGTYKLRDPDTGQVRRTGRSNDLARREGEHGRHSETKDLDFEVDRRTDSYPAQRGREQRIYEAHPEADLNRQRPIAPRNPNRDEYLREGDKL